MINKEELLQKRKELMQEAQNLNIRRKNISNLVKTINKQLQFTNVPKPKKLKSFVFKDNDWINSEVDEVKEFFLTSTACFPARNSSMISSFEKYIKLLKVIQPTINDDDIRSEISFYIDYLYKYEGMFRRLCGSINERHSYFKNIIHIDRRAKNK